MRWSFRYAATPAVLLPEYSSLELFKHRLAPRYPVPRFGLVGGAEPITTMDSLKPNADFLELGSYLLGLLVREIFSEGLELDLLGEVDLAVFDYFPIVIGGLIQELLNQLRLLGRIQLSEWQ